MVDKYPFEQKKKLAEKISKLKTKEHVTAIKDIIFKENPEISVTKKSNSVLMYFHNLKDETYNKLEKFFSKLETERKKQLKKTLSENIDELSTELASENDKLPDRSRYRLSNRERNIIKRKEYEREIDQSNELTFSDTLKTPDSSPRIHPISDVFVKKLK